MSAPRRGRACDACHALKIKCELGAAAAGNPPCQRCVRLEKTCLVTLPVRKKDRIAELEAKLEAMTKLLQAQSIQESSPNASTYALPATPNSLDTGPQTPEPAFIASKKRRLDPAPTGTSTEQGDFDLDHVVPRDVQELLLRKYCNEITPIFPLAVMNSYKELRETYPFLLKAVCFAASAGVVASEAQDELTSMVMRMFDPETVDKATKSIELVQAILIVSFWYRRHPRNIDNVAIDRYMGLAVSISDDIGISTSECAMSPTSLTITGDRERLNSADAWRTWNMCFILSAGLGHCLRIPPRVSWNHNLEMKLSSLEYGRGGLNTDGLLCQLVRAERLCQQITAISSYNNTDTTLEVTDHAKFRQIEDLILDRKAQILSSPSYPSLDLYQHIASMLLHECILHTPTNKQSFSAPYIAERLSMTDFPKPDVRPEHVSSLYSLRDACHRALNAYTSFPISAIASSPMLVFTAKAFFALYLLVKLYVAVTAAGNTFGAYIDAQSLQLETYLERMAVIGDAMCTIDDEYITGKMLQTGRRLRQWVWNYDALRAEAMPLFAPLDAGMEGEVDWGAFDADVGGYGLEELFGMFPV